MLSAVSFLETKEEEFKILRHQEDGKKSDKRTNLRHFPVEWKLTRIKMTTQIVDRKCDPPKNALRKMIGLIL